MQSCHDQLPLRRRRSPSLTIDQDVALRMNDMRSLHVSKALGPTLEYSLTAVIPELNPADLVGKGSDYPAGAGSLPQLPFPRLGRDHRPRQGGQLAEH